MKRIRLLIVAAGLLFCTAAKAQNDVAIATLQHGNTVSVFKGPSALASALAAADEEGGDVITLSQGTFTAAAITKPVSIYGAGFETDNASSTLLTTISGDLTVGRTDNTTLSNVHLEGFYLDGEFKVGGIEITGPLENLRVVKTKLKSMLVQSSNSNTSFDQCVFMGMMNRGNDNTAYKSVIADMFFSNCIMNLGAFRFYSNTGCSIVLDHCIFNAYYNYPGGLNYSPLQGSHNTILTLRNSIYIYSNSSKSQSDSYHLWPSGTMISNCISQEPDIVNYDNCFQMGKDGIFEDGEDGTYSSDRTYVLKSELSSSWIGTDNTEIGIHGGHGFSKVPSTPVVKNLQLGVNGGELNVTYDAITR